MKRVVVLGGLGRFGRAAVEQLGRLGINPQTASRRAGADLRVDANDAASIRAALGAGDVVVDAAGPFHARNTALIETAIDVGFDLIDINDDLGYAERVLALGPDIDQAGIRVLSSASTVSAVAAAVIRSSGVEHPLRMTAFLAPASRRTAKGVALSLARSVGQPVRVLRDGRLQTLRGWSEPRRFAMPPPVGPICGRLLESADAVWLPRIWPTLRDVAMHVDANTLGGNALLRLAARSATVRRLLESQADVGVWFARRFGSSAGGIGYEIEAAGGKISRRAIVSQCNSFVAAVAPAVLAARAITKGRFEHHGLVLPHQHAEPAELFEFLRTLEIQVVEVH